MSSFKPSCLLSIFEMSSMVIVKMFDVRFMVTFDVRLYSLPPAVMFEYQTVMFWMV